MTVEEVRVALIEHVNAGGLIILATTLPFSVGETIPDISDGLEDGKFEHPFVVIREATFDEWWDAIPTGRHPAGGKGRNRALAARYRNHFYEVTTD